MGNSDRCRVSLGVAFISLAAITAVRLLATSDISGFYPPAGDKPAIRGINGAAILPGGRAIRPLGTQLPTGPGAFGLAVSPSGKVAATVNLGPERSSITILESDRQGKWSLRNIFASRGQRKDTDLLSLSSGVQFASERTLWVAEGNSGRVRLIDVSGTLKRLFNLDEPGRGGSYAGRLAFDRTRQILYVVDIAHFRVVVFDTSKAAKSQDPPIASIPTGFLPGAITLSPDGQRLWIINSGLFRYHALPSALPFPPYGFPAALPSAEAWAALDSLRLGNPNDPESNSVLAVDVTIPDKPKQLGFIRTGVPWGANHPGGSAPCGILATGAAVYVSNSHDDTIDVLDPQSMAIRGTIPLALPGFADLKGVIPLGMAFDPEHNWLFVAEAGINAVGVVDVTTNREVAVLPAGWFPAEVAVDHGVLTVINAKGSGTGPSNIWILPDSDAFEGIFRRGSISRIPVPSPPDLASHTRLVFAANGLARFPGRDSEESPAGLPIRHVVIILKEGRSFDEVLGDVAKAENGPVSGLSQLALFGTEGYAPGDKNRFSLQSIDVTPNQHALAERFAFSANFYADGDDSRAGHHWLAGAYPGLWSEMRSALTGAGENAFALDDSLPGRLEMSAEDTAMTPEEEPSCGSLWRHLSRNNVSFRSFGEGFDFSGNQRVLANIPIPGPLYSNIARSYPGLNSPISDQYRADQLIADLEQNYRKPGLALPALLFVTLPGDRTAAPRSGDGFPYKASFVADNDVALGRIVAYLSHSPWWNEMAVFVTESSARGAQDHVDAHRTLLFGIGPYFRKNYCSRRNASFPSILRTTFRLLGIPPLNLFDATAADLGDMLTPEADFSSYTFLPSDPRLFDSSSFPVSSSDSH